MSGRRLVLVAAVVAVCVALRYYRFTHAPGALGVRGDLALLAVVLVLWVVALRLTQKKNR